MYPNIIVCESIAAQHRQERLQEAARERSLRIARTEPPAERQPLNAPAPTGNLRRVWGALYSFVNSLA